MSAVSIQGNRRGHDHRCASRRQRSLHMRPPRDGRCLPKTGRDDQQSFAVFFIVRLRASKHAPQSFPPHAAAFAKP